MNLSEPCIRRPVDDDADHGVDHRRSASSAYRLLSVSALADRSTSRPSRLPRPCPAPAPDTMAASVAAPIERQLSTIAGISSMSSSSVAGHHVDHHPVRSQPQYRRRGARRADGADHRPAPLADRNDDPAEFPQGEPGRLPGAVHRGEFGDAAALGRSTNMAIITSAQAISQIPGVAQVLVYGAQKFAMRVQVDPEAAAARGLSLDDIRHGRRARRIPRRRSAR